VIFKEALGVALTVVSMDKRIYYAAQTKQISYGTVPCDPPHATSIAVVIHTSSNRLCC
jgi:hypothetical protein